MRTARGAVLPRVRTGGASVTAAQRPSGEPSGAPWSPSPAMAPVQTPWDGDSACQAHLSLTHPGSSLRPCHLALAHLLATSAAGAEGRAGHAAVPRHQRGRVHARGGQPQAPGLHRERLCVGVRERLRAAHRAAGAPAAAVRASRALAVLGCGRCAAAVLAGACWALAPCGTHARPAACPSPAFEAHGWPGGRGAAPLAGRSLPG
jgi:hypothetical protein